MLLKIKEIKMYEPREDSFLIQKHIKKYAKGIVLDMGAGSGILALEAAKHKEVKKVIAADINPKVISLCKKQIKNKKISFIKSNLFADIEANKFDLIIFNPPYLPNDPRTKDIALDGGKKGYETIIRFLKQSKSYLKDDGKILLLFSSLSNKEKIDQTLKKLNLKFKLIDSQKLFFEQLYIYLIQKLNKQ